MSYEFYRILHFTGIFMVLTSLGGMAVHMINGGTRAEFPARRWTAIMHGIGLFIALTGGFGMLARLYGGMSLPVWAWIKLGIWLLLGVAPAVLYRAKGAARALFVAVVVLAVLAAATAFRKPFASLNGTTAEQMIDDEPEGADFEGDSLDEAGENADPNLESGADGAKAGSTAED